MELDLQSFFGLHVHTAQLYSLDETQQPAPLHPSLELGSFTRSLLVSQDKRHLFVTPWVYRLAVVKAVNREDKRSRR